MRATPTSARSGPSDADVQIAARLGLARLALATGDAETARVEALRALERDPARPDILTTLGRVYAAARQWDDALAPYDRALVAAASGGGQRGQLMLFDRRGLLEEALRAALRAGATTRANNYATSLLADAPEHPDALAATARAAAEGGELERAQALVERAIAASDSVEARLAAADVALQARTADARGSGVAARRAARARRSAATRATGRGLSRESRRRRRRTSSTRCCRRRIACSRARTSSPSSAPKPAGSSRCSIARCW